MQGLQSLRSPEQVAALRGLTVAEVLGLDDSGNGATKQAPAADAAPATATAEETS